jgi:hypothetical protein
MCCGKEITREEIEEEEVQFELVGKVLPSINRMTLELTSPLNGVAAVEPITTGRSWWERASLPLDIK